jgi:hypothetical protein
MMETRNEEEVNLRPVLQGVSTDSLKFHPDPSIQTLLRSLGGPTPETVSGVASPQSGRRVAVFYPLGYPTLYGPGESEMCMCME